MLRCTEITTSAIVKSGPSSIGAVVLTGGSAATTLTLYDNTSASGTVLLTIKAATNATVTFSPTEKLVASRAIYASISGTAAAAYIMWM